VAEAARRVGVRYIHLDLRPLCINRQDDYLERVRRHDWTISAAMIGFPQEDYSTLDTIRSTGGVVPDDCWRVNMRFFEAACHAAAELQTPYLSAHVGFLDPSRPKQFQKMVDRVRLMADTAGDNGLVLLMETGQETAQELKGFIERLDHPSAAVNFDPANVLLCRG